MSVFHAVDGIKIGPDLENTSDDDRLPIFDFDEWSPQSGVGSMSAGETKILTFEGLLTFRAGQTVLVRPLNPDQFNQTHLLISHAWCPTDGTIKVIVKNMSSSTMDFGNDQWNIGGWNTINP